MRNLWHDDITSEKLLELRNQYIKLSDGHSNDSRIKRFYDDFTCSFVYESNAIEGSPVTEADTYIILSSDSFMDKYSQKDNQEVASLYKGFHGNLIVNKMLITK